LTRINIAIDGPAGAGKSTVAKAVAKDMNIIYLDTGAMYRAVALKAIQSGFDTRDQVVLEALVKDIDIRIEHDGNEQRIFLDGKYVSGDIRTAEVSIGSSNVAVNPAVRIKLVELQRKIAKDNDVVMDGRDIGTYVLPDARHKFFLTASIEERAKRRYYEMIGKGMSDITISQIEKDISYRDKNDSSRAFAPLSKASDAIEIDTTSLSEQEVVDCVLSHITNKNE